MRQLLLYVLIFSILFSCQENQEKAEEERFVPELIGDWVPAGFIETSDKERVVDLPINTGYSFYSNGMVDFKFGFYKPYDKDYFRNRKGLFLGTATKYKVVGDSLKYFSLADSTWTTLKIAKLTKDSLSFDEGHGFRHYSKAIYNLEQQPDFDKIVLSTSGCFGPCPIISVIISSNGEIVFFGVQFTMRNGFFSGTISKKLYQNLIENYQKADIKGIGKDFSGGATDGEEITVSFIQDNRIYKTVSDNRNSGPIELAWANIPLRHLYQNINLVPIPTDSLPTYLRIYFHQFESNSKVKKLAQSETFLLWDYLRKGKVTKHSFQPKFKLGFNPNYYWFPSGEKDSVGGAYDEDEKVNLKEVLTDGRYYKFVIDGKEPETIDIGFNFFDTNFSLSDFKEKNSYD